MGRDDWPTEPMPFQERETFPPFLAPGTADHDLYREAVERLDAGCMTEGLIAQMDSHDPPDVQAARAASEPTPSLHDTITAAASLHVED